MARSRSAAAIIAATLLACGGFASAGTVRPGESRGIGLTGPEVPELLKEAQADPYGLPKPVTCSRLRRQIADLDAVLGPSPDAGAPKKHSNRTLIDGLRGLIPYGGVVRLLTGAGRKERALTHAALAGSERRGFLKGTAQRMGCAGAGPIATGVKEGFLTPPAAPVANAPKRSVYPYSMSTASR